MNGQKPMMIDMTPEGCKTPEGAAKVNEAIRAFEDSAAALANAAMEFFDTYEDDILRMTRDWEIGSMKDDMADIRVMIQTRRKAQEEFLKSLAG